MPFGSLSVIKTQLGINPADTSEDALLTILMNQYSTLTEKYCKRVFSQNTYTEVYSGNGLTELVLQQRPVWPPTSPGAQLVVYENEDAYWGSQQPPWPSTALLTYGTDYALEIDQPDGSSKCGILYRITGVWEVQLAYFYGVLSPFVNVGTGNIQVTYTAGYPSVPLHIQGALSLQIMAVRNTKNYGRLLNTESYSDGASNQSYSVYGELGLGVLTPEVLSILATDGVTVSVG